jgi:hypothetical protein
MNCHPLYSLLSIKVPVNSHLISRKRKFIKAKETPIPKKIKPIDPAEENFTVQNRACIEYGTLFAESLCMACRGVVSKMHSQDRIREKCRFIGFRMMKSDSDGHLRVMFDPGSTEHEYKYYNWESFSDHGPHSSHKGVIG